MYLLIIDLVADDLPDRRDDGAQRPTSRQQLRLLLRQAHDRRHEQGVQRAGTVTSAHFAR